MRETFGDNLAISAWHLTDETLKKVFNRAAMRPDKCDFSPGVLLTAKTLPQAEWIEEEIKQFEEAGFKFASYIPKDRIKDYVNTDLYLNGILFKGDEEGRQYGHLNPLKYTQTVAKLAHDVGAELFEHAPVKGVEALEEGGYLVTTPEGAVKAKNVVLATGVNFMRPKGIDYDVVPRTNVPVQTVILATEPIPGKLAREMVPGDACFCDASDAAMNYGRLIPEPDKPGYFRLTFGGADSLAQIQTALAVKGIEKEMREMFPQLDREGIKVEKVWGGNCDLSKTALPVLINPLPGIYHASGFSGQGMVNTALYGSAIADKILGKDTGKFETLQQLNSDSYSANKILAWVQAARTLFPVAVEARKEQKAENARRAEQKNNSAAKPV